MKSYEEIKSNYDEWNSVPSRTHPEMIQYSDKEPQQRDGKTTTTITKTKTKSKTPKPDVLLRVL